MQAQCHWYGVNNAYLMMRFLYGDENRNEVRLSGSYGRYDFRGLDPIQQTIYRADNIYTAGLFYGRRIADIVQFFAQYNYLKSNSNVTRQLYNTTSSRWAWSIPVSSGAVMRNVNDSATLGGMVGVYSRTCRGSNQANADM